MTVLLRAFLFCVLASLAAAKPLVVTTTTILADFVRVVAGDHVESHCLLKPGVDPHTYDPTPADVRILSKADLLIVNGLGFESWLEKLVGNSGFRGRTATASDGLTPLRAADAHAGHDHAHHHHGSSADEPDPHVWHDLRHARHLVAKIADALVLLLPASETELRKNAAAYLAELAALDDWARALLKTLPPERRKLATSHDSLRYLGHAYDLTIEPIAGLRPDREPSARQLASIVRFIRAQRIRAVFIESTSNPKIPELIAREAGVTVVAELYTDSLGAPGTPGATFLGMFRTNLETIARALR